MVYGTYSYVVQKPSYVCRQSRCSAIALHMRLRRHKPWIRTDWTFLFMARRNRDLARSLEISPCPPALGRPPMAGTNREISNPMALGAQPCPPPSFALPCHKLDSVCDWRYDATFAASARIRPHQPPGESELLSTHPALARTPAVKEMIMHQQM